MPDREKVIRAVDSCFDYWLDHNKYLHPLELEHVRQIKADAIAMMKEQEHKDKMFRALEEDWKRLKEQVAETELCDRCGRRRLKSKRDGR